MTFRQLFTAVLLAAAAFGAHAEAPFAFDTTPGKLPKDVVPLSYDLLLVPDLAQQRFRGRVVVDLQVRRPTARIMLNSLGLEIDSATLGPRAGTAATRLVPQLDAKQQTLAFDLPRPLRPGRYRLAIDYRGQLQHEPQGLYTDRYPAPNGETRQLIATQFEPTDARRMFPNWDEPAFRAVFRLSAELPRDMAAYSNMPIVSERPIAGGARRVRFAPSPRMPSYLVAFFAGDLERRSARERGVELGIVVTRGKGASAEFALAESRRVLAWYDDYFGIGYPLPKLDHIATPGGFAGAMENWGAIAYNEARLLHDPRTQSEFDTVYVSGFMAHETAHQWFGNLVTMAWWDNLWLNEGFASWIAAKAGDALHPSWQVQLGNRYGLVEALALDARASTHPIQTPIETEADAGFAFDSITYNKGMAFLRMLESYVGEAPFRNGIRSYLQRHRMSNATSADLWAALGEAAGKPVTEFASDWTLKPGFPLVTVDAECVAGERRVRLSQAQFTTDPAHGDTADVRERLWRVPVTLQAVPVGAPSAAGAPSSPSSSPAALAGARSATLLATREASVSLPGCAGSLVADPEGAGFYRVEYAPALFAALVEAYPALPDGGRAKLMADTAALAAAGRIPLADYTRLAARLADEPRVTLWSEAVATWRHIDRLLAGEANRPAWRAWARGLLRARFDALGAADRASDGIEQRKLRDTLADALAEFGDTAVLADARDAFHRFLADPTSLPGSRIEAVVRIVARHADVADYEAVQRLAAAAVSTAERERYNEALMSVADPALAERSMALSLSTDLPPFIVNQALPTVAASGHADAAWAWALAHADALLARRTEPFQQAGTFGGVARESARPEVADQLLALRRDRLLPDTDKPVQRAVEVIRERAAVRARLLPQVAGALVPAR